MSDPATNGPAEHDSGLVRLERRVLRLWRIRAGITFGPTVVLAGAAAWALGGPSAGVAVLAVVGIAVAGGVWWWTALVWRAWQFTIGTEALHLRHGVILRRESTIPFHRVQHIDVEAGPLERRLGLTTFVLRTASASSDSAVPGIDVAEAEALRHRVLSLVGTGDAV